MNESTLEKIEALASEIAQREGCRLYDVEFSNGHQGRVLTVYIDKDNGIGVDDCANVSRELNTFLDNDDIIPGDSYSLEVSSPGLERRLKKDWHFAKVVGQTIWVKCNKALEAYGVNSAKLKNAKQLTEKLDSVNEGKIIFDIAGEKIVLPIEAIEKAKLVFEFKKNDKPQGSKKR